MSKKNRTKRDTKKIQIIAIILSVALTSLFAYSYGLKYIFRQKADTPTLEKGVANFANFDFSKHNIAPLKGDVEFYWKKLLPPSAFKDSTPTPDSYIPILGIWNDHKLNGEKIPGFGYATYHFKVKVKEDGVYAFKTPDFFTSFIMWGNEKRMVSSGTVGETSKTTVPRWEGKELYVESQNKEIDVVLQISNFSHWKGGPERPILFGPEEKINYHADHELSIAFFMAGVLFILSIYLFMIYLFRKEEKTVLIFSILCFLMLIRLCCTGEKIAYDIFPNIPWFLSVRLEYLSYITSLPLLFIYGASFFKKDFSKAIIDATIYITIFTAFLIIVLPAHIFTHIPQYHQLLGWFISFYVLYELVILSIKKKENALTLLVAYLLFFLILLNDLLLLNQVINTVYLMPVGFIMFAFIQTILLSRNFSENFFKIEQLTTDLEKYNRELEFKIEERTHEIAEQRDEIEAQAENLRIKNQQLIELNTFKDSLSEMIVHDLKNPLNIILNFSDDERVLFAGNQMLNLVQNLLDVGRYENSKMQLRKESVSVNKLINEGLYQVNFLIKEKYIEIEIHNDGNYFIDADFEIINRVFVNLMSNALKFTPSKGKITIDVKTKDNSLIFEITDGGPGIPKEKKDLVFEKFGQLISNPKGHFGSSGLGLTFCKMAIEAHSGKIDFTSVLGKGTTFYIELPIGVLANNISSPLEFIEQKTHEFNLNLSTEEKNIISQIIESLNDTEIYEIGKLKKLLTSLSDENSDNIKDWVAAVQKSIWNADEPTYRFLIKLASK